MRRYRMTVLCLGCLVLLTSPGAAWQVSLSSEAPADEHADAPDSSPIDTGIVFIDGEYLPAPYTVTTSDDGDAVLVNGRELPGAVPQRPPRSNPPRNGFGGRFRGGSDRGFGRGWQGAERTFSPDRWSERIRQRLKQGSTIVAFTDGRIQTLSGMQNYALLKCLLEPDPQPEFHEMVAPRVRTSKAESTWAAWLRDYRPDEAFRQRATSIIEFLDTTEARNLAATAAVRRFEAVVYPLTILGMIMSVIAFGHLLMSLPNSEAMKVPAEGRESGISREVVRATMISVLLVAALSGLDLVWTILASQAGQMRELNPIASHYIEDPFALIAFKSAATILGCGLLYALRRHGRAQMASWWMCLVCTMLTFRWLMFNSMFVS